LRRDSTTHAVPPPVRPLDPPTVGPQARLAASPPRGRGGTRSSTPASMASSP